MDLMIVYYVIGGWALFIGIIWSYHGVVWHFENREKPPRIQHVTRYVEKIVQAPPPPPLPPTTKELLYFLKKEFKRSSKRINSLPLPKEDRESMLYELQLKYQKEVESLIS